MGAYDDEAPRLSEIVRMLQGMDRKFDDFRTQVNRELTDKVSLQRYEPERNWLLDKVNHSDTKFTNLEARLKSLANVFYGSLGSLVVGGILLYIGR